MPVKEHATLKHALHYRWKINQPYHQRSGGNSLSSYTLDITNRAPIPTKTLLPLLIFLIDLHRVLDKVYKNLVKVLFLGGF